MVSVIDMASVSILFIPYVSHPSIDTSSENQPVSFGHNSNFHYNTHMLCVNMNLIQYIGAVEVSRFVGS